MGLYICVCKTSRSKHSRGYHSAYYYFATRNLRTQTILGTLRWLHKIFPLANRNWHTKRSLCHGLFIIISRTKMCAHIVNVFSSALLCLKWSNQISLRLTEIRFGLRAEVNMKSPQLHSVDDSGEEKGNNDKIKSKVVAVFGRCWFIFIDFPKYQKRLTNNFTIYIANESQ